MTTATDSMSVPKGWVILAALALILAAAAGTYLGVERSLGAHDLPSDSDTLSAVPNVTNATPLADTESEDAHIRSVVREEVAAALKTARPAAPKPAAAKPDDDATSGSNATAALNAAASGRSTASESAATKPATVAKPVAPRPTSTATNPYPATLSSPN